MSQTFVGVNRVPVTKIQAGPCVVTAIKNKDKDGYWAVQIGYGEKKIKNVTKPMQGHLKGAVHKKTAPRFLREVKSRNEPKVKVGDAVLVSDVFSEGDVIAVTGTSKGKGFQGVVKRWGFRTSGRSHGQKGRRRSPGSIGQGTTPGRVHKGKKMAGRMGTDTVTVKNLRVVSIDEDKNEIALSGPVPGNAKGLLIIKKVKSGKLADLGKAAEVEKVEQGEEGEVSDESETKSDGKAEKTEEKRSVSE